MNLNTKLIDELKELLKQSPYSNTYLGMYRTHFIEWFEQHINTFDNFEQIKKLIEVTYKYIKRDSTNPFLRAIMMPKRCDEITTKVSVTRTKLIKDLEEIKETLEVIWRLQTPETKELLALIKLFKENPNKLIPIPDDAINNRKEIEAYLNKYPLTTKDKKSYFKAIDKAKNNQIESFK